MTNREEILEYVVTSIGGYWKWPLSLDEIEALDKATTNWSDLNPLLEALDHAIATLDDKPSIAWMLKEANRRRPETRTTRVRSGCPECKGERWRQTSEGRLQHCPECNPLGYDIQVAGHYDPDAPSQSPEQQLIVDQHRSGKGGTRPTGRTVLLPASEPLDDPGTRQLMNLARAHAMVGAWRGALWDHLKAIARAKQVEIPKCVIGDDSTLVGVLNQLEQQGAEIHPGWINPPTAEDVVKGTPLPPVPTHRDHTLQRFTYT